MANKVKETFKDEKGTFHYESISKGDWKEGNEIIFEGRNKGFIDGGYKFKKGTTYIVAKDPFGDVGPKDCSGFSCSVDYFDAFKFSRKVYEVVESINDVEEEKEKDSPKQEKSLDNLLKELHNLKQEEKELSVKVDNILKEINSIVGLYGLDILFTNKYDMLQEND